MVLWAGTTRAVDEVTTSMDLSTNRRDCFATAVRKASRRLTQIYDDALAPSGLRSTQFTILVELATRSGAPPTLTALADSMVADRSSVGHALRPLIRDGYVALRKAKTDRRAQHVVLTDSGRDAFRDGVSYWKTAQETIVSRYGEAWSAAFRATVLRIAHDDGLGDRSADPEPRA